MLSVSYSPRVLLSLLSIPLYIFTFIAIFDSFSSFFLFLPLSTFIFTTLSVHATVEKKRKKNPPLVVPIFVRRARESNRIEFCRISFFLSLSFSR